MQGEFNQDVRRFLLHSVSETFAEVRRFVLYREYSKEKVINGLLELCAALNIDLIRTDEPPPQVERGPILHLVCMKCNRSFGKRGRYNPCCGACERSLRQELGIGKGKILKLVVKR